MHDRSLIGKSAFFLICFFRHLYILYVYIHIHITVETLGNVIKLIYTIFILCIFMYNYDIPQSIYQDRDLVYLDTLDNKIILLFLHL